MLDRLFGNRDPDPTVPPLRITSLAPNTAGISALVRKDGITRSVPIIAWAAVHWATMDTVEGIVLDGGQMVLAPVAGDEFVGYEETDLDHY